MLENHCYFLVEVRKKTVEREAIRLFRLNHPPQVITEGNLPPRQTKKPYCFTVGLFCFEKAKLDQNGSGSKKLNFSLISNTES